MPNPRPRVLIAATTAELPDFGDLFLQTQFDVIGRVSTGEDLVSAAHILQPSIIICSISALGGLEQPSHLIAKCGSIPFVLVGADFHLSGVLNYPGVASYVDKADMALDLDVAVRLALSGIGFRSRSIPPLGADPRDTKRIKRQFQIEISGEDAAGTSFSEQAVTVDVSEGGCCFELLRPLRLNALIMIRLTDDRSGLSPADRDQFFKVVWIEKSEHGWAIGVVTLEDKTPWAMNF